MTMLLSCNLKQYRLLLWFSYFSVCLLQESESAASPEQRRRIILMMRQLERANDILDGLGPAVPQSHQDCICRGVATQGQCMPCSPCFVMHHIQGSLCCLCVLHSQCDSEYYACAPLCTPKTPLIHRFSIRIATSSSLLFPCAYLFERGQG